MIAELHDTLHDIRPHVAKGVIPAGSQHRTVWLRKEWTIFSRWISGTLGQALRELKRLDSSSTRSVRIVSSASTTLETKYRMEETMPRIDVARQEGSVIVRLNAQGMRREDMRIEFFDGVLMLSGVCIVTDEGELGRRETFFHNVTLPAGITAEDAQIAFHDNALEVTILSSQLQESRELEYVRG